MMHPKQLFQLKSMFENFRNNHPKVPLFFKQAYQDLDVNSIVEIQLTTSNGKNLCTNMRIKPDDIELLRTLIDMIFNEKK